LFKFNSTNGDRTEKSDLNITEEISMIRAVSSIPLSIVGIIVLKKKKSVI
jgi:hypothetical protein